MSGRRVSHWGVGRRDVLRLVRAAGLATLAELAGLALIGVAAWLLLRAAEQPPMAALTVAIVAVRTLALLRGGLRYAERLAGHETVLSLTGGVRARVYHALLPRLGPHRPPGDSGSSARDLTRVVSDVDDAQDAVLRCLLPACVAALTGTVTVSVSALLSPAAASASAVGLAIAGLLLPWLAARAGAAHAARVAPARTRVAEHAVDLARGTDELLAYGARGRALATARAAVRDLERAERFGPVHAIAAAGLLLQFGSTVAVCLLARADGASGPLTAALAMATLATFEAVLPLPAAAPHWVRVRGSLRRLADLLAEPAPSTGSRALPPGPPHLRVRNLEIRYPGRPVPALSGVDIDLPPGTRLAVTGPNGSGKSTLLHAVLGLVGPTSGQVTLNGTDLRELDPAVLPTVVSGATADAHVFRMTVRENLLLTAPGATEDELRACCAAADLDCDPEQDATTLSGGQRQRLVLARAVLARPRVLVLDEPVVGLDPVHADRVLAGVLRACAGATVLLATHDDPPPGFAVIRLA